jgi:predicted DNA-binding transcriptional regulator AlpA
MSTRKKPLSDDEIRAALPAGTRAFVPLKEFCALTGIPRSTLHEWKSKGRLDGAFRKRGKLTLIWIDRAIKLIFNGPEWA